MLGHYVQELGLLPLERAIHKMTGGPARALKLRDRGRLALGYRADVTLSIPRIFASRRPMMRRIDIPAGRAPR
ncbi:MAG: amidohydrolase family protein [Pseudomonadota bacterium]